MLLSAQSTDNKATIRIRKVENINGVTKVTDTTYFSDKLSDMQIDEGVVNSFEAPGKDGQIQKIVVLDDKMGNHPEINIEDKDGKTIIMIDSDLKGTDASAPMKKIIIEDLRNV